MRWNVVSLDGRHPEGVIEPYGSSHSPEFISARRAGAYVAANTQKSSQPHKKVLVVVTGRARRASTPMEGRRVVSGEWRIVDGE